MKCSSVQMLSATNDSFANQKNHHAVQIYSLLWTNIKCQMFEFNSCLARDVIQMSNGPKKMPRYRDKRLHKNTDILVMIILIDHLH